MAKSKSDVSPAPSAVRIRLAMGYPRILNVSHGTPPPSPSRPRCPAILFSAPIGSAPLPAALDDGPCLCAKKHLHCICRAATRSSNLPNGQRMRNGEGGWLGHGSLASFHADDVDRELWLDGAGMGPRRESVSRAVKVRCASETVPPSSTSYGTTSGGN
jgi:hypothetical protein